MTVALMIHHSTSFITIGPGFHKSEDFRMKPYNDIELLDDKYYDRFGDSDPNTEWIEYKKLNKPK